VIDVATLLRADARRSGWAGTEVQHAEAQEIVVHGVICDLSHHGSGCDRLQEIEISYVLEVLGAIDVHGARHIEVVGHGTAEALENVYADVGRREC